MEYNPIFIEIELKELHLLFNIIDYQEDIIKNQEQIIHELYKSISRRY